MSAVMSDTNTKTELRLPATKEMPRELWISWERYGPDGQHFHAHAHAFTRIKDRSRSIAYAGTHDPRDVHLTYETQYSPCLWFRHAQLDLTDSEAAEVERVLGPLGLRIERKEQP